MSTPIKREDIREGDVIERRLTFTANSDGINPGGATDEHFLISRPVQLPLVRGVYLDKDGAIWDWQLDMRPDYLRPEYAPYTLLRPVALTAAEVLGEVRNMHMTDDPTYWGRLDALAAKWATK